jgi:hypothetical protein
VTTDEKLWTKRDVAEYLGVNVRTVERMPIPRIPILITGKRPIVRYDPIQVKAWIDKKRTRSLKAVG